MTILLVFISLFAILMGFASPFMKNHLNKVLKVNLSRKRYLFSFWSIALVSFIVALIIVPKQATSDSLKQTNQVTKSITTQPKVNAEKLIVTKALTATTRITERPKATQMPTTIPQPTPTNTPAQNKQEFIQSAGYVSMADLNKDPNSYNNKQIIVSCQLVNFVKSNNGDILGFNCDDTNDFTNNVQVQLAYSDFHKLNKGDYLTIYGQGEGVVSGYNAFGATVTQPQMAEEFIEDQTNGYSSF